MFPGICKGLRTWRFARVHGPAIFSENPLSLASHATVLEYVLKFIATTYTPHFVCYLLQIHSM